MIARLVLAVMLLCSAAGLSPAAAQGAVQWWGTGVQGHLPMQANGGPAPLLMDAGGSPGAGLQPTNNANAGTLPTGVGFINTGQGICQWTGYASAAYSELCSGFDGNGNALFTVDRIGGGTPPDCNFSINGVLTPCGGKGTVTQINITANNGITLVPDPITVTGTVACTAASATLFGCVPASGGGTTNFLRADFTWAPTSGGTVTSVGLSTPGGIFGITGTNPITSSGTFGYTTSGAAGDALYFSSATQVDALAGCVGGVLNWSTASSLSCTATPTLGASGTLGSLAFGNATSGTVTLETVTGALGTVTASLPANTGTIAELNLKQSWTAAQRGTPVNVTISTSTFTPNFDSANHFEIDLTSACPCTLANPSTTLVPGQSGMIEIHQDGSGSRTIGTWGTEYQYVGGTASITLSTAASAVDYLAYYVNNAGTGIVLGSILNAPAH